MLKTNHINTKSQSLSNKTLVVFLAKVFPVETVPHDNIAQEAYISETW